MNISSRLFLTSAKAALLSSLLLSIYLISDEGNIFPEVILFFLISIVITFIISAVMLVVTVFPFYEFSKEKNLKRLFNTYFPYYSTAFFLLNTIFAYYTGFNNEVTIIPIIAFITGVQSWVWFFKPLKMK